MQQAGTPNIHVFMNMILLPRTILLFGGGHAAHSMRERRDFDGKTKPTFETKRWGDIDFTCTRPVSDVLLPLAAEAHVEADQQQR